MYHFTRFNIVAALSIIIAIIAACYAPMTVCGVAAYLVLARLARAYLRAHYTPTSRAVRRAQRRLLIAKED